jgi:hypothetical protein
MKALIAIVCVLLMSEITQADELATTAGGRKVLLKDDGTWIDAEKPSTTSPPLATTPTQIKSFSNFA